MGKQRDRKIINAELKQIVVENAANVAEFANDNNKSEFDAHAEDIIFGSNEDFLVTLEKTFGLYSRVERTNPIYDQVVNELNFSPLAR